MVGQSRVWIEMSGMYEDLNSVEFDKNTENKDLVWDLEEFNQRRRAHEFVLNFENKICVFSGSVEQLYTNYNIFMPTEEHSRLVILPNPYAHHDIYQGIPEKAIKATGLFIVAGDDGELLLRIPVKARDSQHREIPLQIGFRIINQKRPKHLPLLPVLVKGDLRELDSKRPCLHLHALTLSALEDHSVLEINGIRRTILERVRFLN